VVKLRELLEISRQPEQLVIWAMTDLLRKVHAAARMLREGTPAGVIAKDLRLWGSARHAVIDVAGRHDPVRLAELLSAAIHADMANKRGLGRPERTLETLAVRIADTISCP
jgi:DNA polymerase III delta subunit